MTARRRSDAIRNDERILDAARSVFAEQGSAAPVSAIADRAGIGIGSLYRRYESKEDLMRELLLSAIEQTAVEAKKAIAIADPWIAVRTFLIACAEAGVGGAPADVSCQPVTEEILLASKRAREAVQLLVDRAQADGSLRADVNAHDLVLMLTELRRGRRSMASGQPRAMYRRLAEITIDGLRAEAASPLPEPPTTWRKVRAAWSKAWPVR